MALAKPSVSLTPAENASRIGAAIEAIDGANASLGALQQQIVDVSNAAIRVDGLRAAGDKALQEQISTLSRVTSGNANGIISLQDQISGAVAALNRINTQVVRLAPVVSGNSSGIVVLQQQIIDVGNSVISVDARLSETLAGKLAFAESDATNPTDRPGEALGYFTTSLAGGDPSALSRPDGVLVASGDNGRILRMSGAGIVARRRLEPIEDGRTYRPRVAVRRRVDASDPSNDGVRVAIAWYDQNRLPLAGPTGTTVLGNLTALTVGLGRQQVGGLVSTSGVTPTVKPPAGARYARLFVQCFGTDHVTDIEVMSWRDVTDSTLYAPDLTAIDARLGAVESARLPDRVGLLERNAGAPLSAGFPSRLAAQTAAIPAAINTLDVLGYADPGDGSGARYRRSTGRPGHPWSVQSKDGAWFEIQGRRTLGQIGATGDGTTDNRPILAKVPAGAPIDIDLPGRYRVSSGTIGSPGSVIRFAPGARIINAQTSGVALAPGAGLMTFNGGESGDVWVWARKLQGVIKPGSGPLDSGYSPAAFCFDIRADTADASAGIFSNGLAVRHIFGGPTAKGGRQGLVASLSQQLGPTAADNGDDAYCPFQSSVYSAGDGGVDSNAGARGEYYGFGAACYGFGDTVADPKQAPMKNALNLTGGEINHFTVSGTTAKLMSNLSLVAGKRARGTMLDAALAISAYIPAYEPLVSLGWTSVFAITDSNAASPVDKDTTLFNALWLKAKIYGVTNTNPAKVYLAAPTTHVQVGDTVTIGGVGNGNGYNGTFGVSKVDQATANSLTTLTLNADLTGASGAPDFSNATIKVQQKLISKGFDMSGLTINGPMMNGVFMALYESRLSLGTSNGASRVEAAGGSANGNLVLAAQGRSGKVLLEANGVSILSVLGSAAASAGLALQAVDGGAAPYFLTGGDFAIRSTGNGVLDIPGSISTDGAGKKSLTIKVNGQPIALAVV